MTITTTSLGAYTKQITLSGEINGNGLISAMDSVIVSSGWDQWDITTSTKIYRSLNKDHVTYKYIGIYLDPYNGKINTTCYESWNKTTHVGTNEVCTFGRTGEMGYSLSNTDIIILVSSNWLLIQTYIADQPSQWSGVVEFQREISEDVSPCFAWVCSSFIFNKSNSTQYNAMSFPRTIGGLTGAAATSKSGWQTSVVRLGTNTNLNGADLINYVNSWDPANKIIMSLRPTISDTEIHGRAIGLKALYNAGAPFNKINVLVDEYFNYSSTGYNTEHWLLGETLCNPSAIGKTGGSGNALSSTSSLNSTGVAVICTGSNYYITTSSGTAGLQKLSATGTLGTAITVSGAPSGALDLVFDGQYVYVATAAGISRFDTFNNDSVKTLSLPNGASTLCYDGNWIWASSRGTRINNIVYSIDPISFTLTATIMLPNTTTASIGGICSDTNGSVAIPLSNSTIHKIASSTWIISTMTATLGSLPLNRINSLFDGVNYIFSYDSTTVFSNICQVVDIKGISQSTTGFTAAGAALSPSHIKQGGIFKYGQYVVVSPALTSPTILGVALPSSNFMGVSSLMQTSGSAVTLTCVYSDGTKIFGCNGNTFFQYTNINHPDDGVIPHGRLAIPK